MENFKSWLKFYFLGFFSNELSEEGAYRGFWNVLLSMVLSFILLCGGLAAGYTASFGVQYKNSESFREFLYSAFASYDASTRINLKIENGELVAGIPGGKQQINAMAVEESGYNINGYKLVLDTRPAESAFDDFTVTCKDGEGNEISYENYKNLDETASAKATIAVKYSGISLDVAANQGEYINYLEKISLNTDEEYNSDVAKAYEELKNKKNEGEIEGEEYINEVYKLYFKAYYPSLKGMDAYGEAPTLRSYYLNSQSYTKEDKYLILLNDVCICLFKNEKGLSVDFAGYYSSMSDTVISADGLSVSEMCANVDGLIKGAFKGGSGLNFLVYLISLFKLLPLFVLIMIFVALLVFLVCKLKRLEMGAKFMCVFKIMSAYLLVSAIVAFIFTMIFSFILPRAAVFNYSGIVLLAVMVIRTVILLVTQLIKNKRTPTEEDEKAA